MDETIDFERRTNTDSSVTGTNDGSSDDSTRGPGGRFTFGSGSKPLEGYTIKRAIGRGGFGEVYYAVTDAGKEVALKLITRNLDVERRGVMQCMNLKSPHLITVHDLRTTDEGDSFVIMEYVSGPNLASVLEKYPNGMPMDLVRQWLLGLVDGVTYLHDHGTVHRDLKPANLFMEEGVVKIGDYGLSKAITHSREPGHSQSVGTCHYMAPEIGTGKYHKPIDIYAIGVILYEMITGRVPFDGESVHEVLMKHLTARPDLSPLAEPYRTIVGQALAKDPNHRPARAIDLLPPGDAPKVADMRYIPESAKTAAGSTAKADDVLRIGPDDPVFYIGPETQPPRRRAARVRAAARRGFNQFAPPRAAAVAKAPAPKARPAAPEPPPAPPAPAVGPAKFAELATSMLVAAPVTLIATVLSVPVFALSVGKSFGDPTQLTMIFAMTLLGTWGVLVPSKIWETRPASKGARRLTYLGVGAAVGLAGAVLSQWAHLNVPGGVIEGPATDLASTLGERLRPEAVVASTMASYFGLVFAVGGFGKLAARDRRARFRVWPMVGAAILGGLIGAFLPSRQPWGTIVFALIAAVTQLSSPWNREAAAYARYREAVGTPKPAKA